MTVLFFSYYISIVYQFVTLNAIHIDILMGHSHFSLSLSLFSSLFLLVLWLILSLCVVRSTRWWWWRCDKQNTKHQTHITDYTQCTSLVINSLNLKQWPSSTNSLFICNNIVKNCVCACVWAYFIVIHAHSVSFTLSRSISSFALMAGIITGKAHQWIHTDKWVGKK